MKLKIGSEWRKQHEWGYEQLIVDGLESIEQPLAKGETVLPKDGNSFIEVTITNSFTDYSSVTVKRLDSLLAGWEKVE